MVGLYDPGGLFQPNWYYDFVLWSKVGIAGPSGSESADERNWRSVARVPERSLGSQHPWCRLVPGASASGRREMLWAFTCNIYFKYRVYSLQFCFLQERGAGSPNRLFYLLKKIVSHYRDAYNCLQTCVVGTRCSSASPWRDPARCRAEPKPAERPALLSNYSHQRRFYFDRFPNKPVISETTGCCCWPFLADRLAPRRVV